MIIVILFNNIENVPLKKWRQWSIWKHLKAVEAFKEDCVLVEKNCLFKYISECDEPILVQLLMKDFLIRERVGKSFKR